MNTLICCDLLTPICPHSFHIIKFDVHNGLDDVEQELLRRVWPNRVEPYGCGEEAPRVEEEMKV